VSSTAVIHHVYVVPDSREVGLGDSLIQALISDLPSRGVKEIEAQALPGDRGMKNLFERHGLIAQTIIVGKSL
jgi:L-amino acid N-acyltransferase YncA